MARKKKAEAPVPAPQPVKKRPTQTKIELTADQLEEVRAVARSIGLPLSTFVRLAVMEKVREIQRGKG